MINLKKTYYYRIIGTYLLLSLAMGEDLVYLWDLGVKIESQPQIMMTPEKTKTELSENKKYAAIDAITGSPNGKAATTVG